MGIEKVIVSEKTNCILETFGNVPYTDDEKISEVIATLNIENMELDNNDIEMLKAIKSGKISFDEARTEIMKEF